MPQLLNEATLPDIKVILDEYPFFQAARMLWVKNLHTLEHIRFNNELKLAAIHIPDRARLYNLLQSSEFGNQNPASENLTLEHQSELKPEVIQVPDSIDIPEVPAGSDYFNVDDTFDVPSGEKVDFSTLISKDNDDGVKYAFPSIEENMVLPSADLLDYERPESGYYNLAEQDHDLNLDEYRSFSAWLKVLRQKPVCEPENSKAQNPVKPKGIKKDLIDSFLQKGTKKKINVSHNSDIKDNIEDISLKSLQESDDLMTETLANIYIQQKHFSKAIEIFERLGLKYPEKNIYFARRIKELEEQINNQ